MTGERRWLSLPTWQSVYSCVLCWLVLLQPCLDSLASGYQLPSDVVPISSVSSSYHLSSSQTIKDLRITTYEGKRERWKYQCACNTSNGYIVTYKCQFYKLHKPAKLLTLIIVYSYLPVVDVKV